MSAEPDSDWRFGFEARPGRKRLGRTPGEGALVAARYRVLGELGRGTNGVVHRALDVETGREVALKVVRGKLTERGQERLRREGVLTASLDHPGIVRVEGSGETADGPFLAYELVPGATSLEAALPRLDRARRLEIFREVVAAIAHAHERGVVHRDLKATNVLLDTSGRARVVDFGIAWTREAESLTQSGTVVGSPRSMAPEQIFGSREERGQPIDVWALGVLLYGLLADAPPFEGATLLELKERIGRASPVPLRERDASIPHGLEAVCRGCLEREPARRFADARALEAALAGPPAPRRGEWALAAVALGGLAAALALVARPEAPLAGSSNELAPTARLASATTATSASASLTDEATVAGLERRLPLAALAVDRAQNARLRAAAPALYRLGLARRSRPYLSAAHRLDAPPADLALAVGLFWRTVIDDEVVEHVQELWIASGSALPESFWASLGDAFACFGEAHALARAPAPWRSLVTLRGLLTMGESRERDAALRTLRAWPGNPTLCLCEGYFTHDPATRIAWSERGLAFLEHIPPGESEEVRVLTARLLTMAAEESDKLGDPARALAFVRRLHGVAPDSANTHDLALRLERVGAWQEIVDAIRIEDVSDAKLSVPGVAAVRARCELGRAAEARALARSVLARRPDLEGAIRPLLDAAR